ncbi:MAG: DEAD/DEAH box helicase [Candidatus Micrarchaeota archaeon]|nr:DEAD/DEAH box helicase [Candidatus Micrarchaeota archaeon]
MKQFSEMNLKPELIESLKRQGFITCTEVQERAIPEVMAGKNVVARAKTGTGKTGAFIVPIMQRIEKSRDIDALIIVPTRELAIQVAAFSEKVGSHMHIKTTTVYGGASINMQMHALRSGTNIVVGTPGRLIDLFERGALDLHRIKFLVLDEADVMLDMGFIEDVEMIISRTPKDRQMMMFSATMPREIIKIADRYSSGHDARITVGEEEDLTVKSIQQSYAIVPARLKFSALLAYIQEYKPKKSIIFSRTKYEANALHRVLLSQKYDAILMHGGLTQSMRERSLGAFRKGAQFLIATNVAARGLDIPDISNIINFGAPEDPNTYIHRVGRTARMGKDGKAFTLIDPEQRRQITDIQDYANVRMEKIELNLEPFANMKLPISDPDRGERSFRPRMGGGGFRGGGGGGGFRGGGRSFHRSGGRREGSEGGNREGGGGGGFRHRSGGGGFRGGGRSFHRSDRPRRTER